jgi:hypothetical protein
VPHPSSTRLLVLHGLRLKHIVEPAVLACAMGLEVEDVVTELKGAEAEGLVQRRDGQLSGWRLLPPGRAEHDQLLVDELDAAGARDSVDAAYRRFLAVNSELLSVCTAWQLRDGVVNDHLDASYDAEVVQRLREHHDQSAPIAAELASILDRFGAYPVRLTHAVEEVLSGATEWFTRPLLDSYHTIWFELHEDLLSTLGLERGAESTRSE